MRRKHAGAWLLLAAITAGFAARGGAPHALAGDDPAPAPKGPGLAPAPPARASV